MESSPADQKEMEGPSADQKEMESPPADQKEMETSPEYVIYHPEKLRLIDIFSALVLRRTLSSADFVEYNIHDESNSGKGLGQRPRPPFPFPAPPNFPAFFTMIMQRFLISFLSVPMKAVGRQTEFMANFLTLNGGNPFSVARNIITGRLKIPKEGSANYLSAMGAVDDRLSLYHFKNPQRAEIHLAMMAAKLAYENGNYVKEAVTKAWKMNFVGFFDCYNKYQNGNLTQAYMFTDKPTNAKLIVVAFRGTEVYSAEDWATDADLSWFTMGNMGKVHLGFMKALGLQDLTDSARGWPKNYTGNKQLAYYVTRDKIKALLGQHKGAKVLITGHSLGGALAALYPSILMLHQEKAILDCLVVYTFGQPKVGDRAFGNTMDEKLNGKSKKYLRVVYRYDSIPRVPVSEPIAVFVHFGGCLYFDGWFKGEFVKREPYQNLLDPRFLIPVYMSTRVDLFNAINANRRFGKEFQESGISMMVRLFGQLSPGIANHSPRDYVNAIRLANVPNLPHDNKEE